MWIFDCVLLIKKKKIRLGNIVLVESQIKISQKMHATGV